MKMLIDLYMDVYNTQKERKEACIEYVKDQLDSTAITVNILWVEAVDEEEKGKSL